jgi:predicted amidohydrolase YtcJ
MAVTAITQALRNAATELGQSEVRTARHRLEHVEAAGEQDWQVFADLGVVASMQPGFDAAWGGDQGMYAARLGGSRAVALNNFAAAAKAGVTLAFGSDSPVIEIGPWAAVRAAVHHCDRPDPPAKRDRHRAGAASAAAG